MKSLTRPLSEQRAKLSRRWRGTRGLANVAVLRIGETVWLKDCNFLGDERAASRPGGDRDARGNCGRNSRSSLSTRVRLLISAGKVR